MLYVFHDLKICKDCNPDWQVNLKVNSRGAQRLPKRERFKNCPIGV